METEQELQLTGKIKNIIFEKDEFKIIEFCTNEHIKESTTVVGSFYGVTIGEEIRIFGKWETHPKFGKQFAVRWWERDIPTTKEGIISYLSSPLIKGCGKKKAKRILNTLGESCLEDIIHKGAGILLQVNGIGEKQAKSIYESIVATFEVQSVMKELLPLGLTPSIINKAFLKYKGGTVQLVKENPYKLTHLKLIGFQIADKIARKVDVSPLSTYRIDSCIEYTLGENTFGSGHCFLPIEELILLTVKELNHPFLMEKEDLLQERKSRKTTRERMEEIDKRIEFINDHFSDESTVIEGIIRLAEQNTIVNEEGNIYPSYIYMVETQLAEKIATKMQVPMKKVDVSKVEEIIGQYEKEEGIVLAEAQRRGIIAITQHPLLILTGGAGTGKTTVTKGMIYVFKKLYPSAKIGLSAPTGRASRKLSEVTGIEESVTIHRIIGYRQGESPLHDEENPLEYDLLLVDEVSMKDAPLSVLLFKALKPTAQVLFVGDPDQLPSVGVGAVLKDMLQAEVPQVRLTEIFRQAQESQIVMNSHRINKGKKIEIDPKKDDFYFIEKEEPTDIADTIKRSVLRFIQLGYTINDIMVLSPMKKGVIGTHELNKMLQSVLNPPTPDKEQMEKYGVTYRLGDKVIQMKNNQDKDINNGDIGFIQDIYDQEDGDGEKERTIVVNFGNRIASYIQEDLEELQLAYCISIHKSQGGQAPIVIIPTSTSHFKMLVRNLFYTGVTRAEKKVVLIGTKKALNIAIRNNQTTKRYTLLTKRIRYYIDQLKDSNKKREPA